MDPDEGEEDLRRLSTEAATFTRYIHILVHYDYFNWTNNTPFQNSFTEMFSYLNNTLPIVHGLITNLKVRMSGG